MLVVVRAAQGVGVLDDDVHGHKGSDAAQQRANELPQQNGGPVLLEGQAVPGGVGRQPVAQGVVPIEAVETAGDEAQQNQLQEARRGPAVPGAGRIDIAGQGVDEIPAVNTAGKEVQQDVRDEAAVCLQTEGGVARGRRRCLLILGAAGAGLLILVILVVLSLLGGILRLLLGGAGFPLGLGVLRGLGCLGSEPRPRPGSPAQSRQNKCRCRRGR